ncbi:MAG: glycosyltransferase family A protein [Actinomycetota bacterium]
MRITVIVPTKDRCDFLKVALDSIEASLAVAAQRHGITHEVIVVDDGSSDDTMAMLGERDVIALPNRGRGVSAGRNTGIEAASGELLLFLDDDDAWTPEHVSLHVRAHAEEPPVGITYSQGWLADADLEPTGDPQPEPPLPAGWIQRSLLEGKVQSFTTFAIRREVFDDAGLFDESLRTAEDLELVQRIGAVAEFRPIEQGTVRWRQHLRAAGGYEAWQRIRAQDRAVLAITAARAKELGMSPMWRLRRSVRVRGWSVHEALLEADRCAADGRTGDVRRLLLAAMRTSPVHAVKDARFLRHLRSLVPR